MVWITAEPTERIPVELLNSVVSVSWHYMTKMFFDAGETKLTSAPLAHLTDALNRGMYLLDLIETFALLSTNHLEYHHEVEKLGHLSKINSSVQYLLSIRSFADVKSLIHHNILYQTLLCLCLSEPLCSEVQESCPLFPRADKSNKIANLF